MRDEPVLAGVSGWLLEYLRDALCPGVLSDRESVKLAYPGADEEFRLGLSLYDLEEIRPGGPPHMVPQGEDLRRFPDLAISMHYLVFPNRKAPFRGVEAVDEMLMLEGVLRAVSNRAGLEWGGQRLLLSLQPLDLEGRSALWQSLGQPLQPAVYLTIEPVPIPSGRVLRVPVVRSTEADVDYLHKEDG